MTDVRARRMKLIGPPVTRFREDPVRMLRAVRLAAKLGLTIDPKTAEPIPRLAPLMANVPPARLFDEMQKLLLSGHSVETLRSLRAHGLSHGLLPLLDVILEQPLGQKFIDAALAGTDARVREGKGVSPAFLFATLLWHEVLADLDAGEGARREAACRRCSTPWTRCCPRRPSASRFRAASRRRSRRYGRCSRASSSARGRARSACSSTRAFAPHTISSRCAARAARSPQALVDWWTRFQDAGDDERDAMLRPDEAPKKRRRPRGRGRKRGSDAARDAPGDDAPAAPETPAD